MAAVIEPKAERFARVWLWSTTLALPLAAVCLALSSFSPSRAIFLLPMLNCAAIWALVLFGARRTIAAGTKLRLELVAGRSREEASSEIRELQSAAWSLLPLLLWPLLLIPITWIPLILGRSAV